MTEAVTKVGASTIGSITLLDALPVDGDSKKILISGLVALATQLIGEVFKLLREKRRKAKINATHE